MTERGNRRQHQKHNQVCNRCSDADQDTKTLRKFLSYRTIQELLCGKAASRRWTPFGCSPRFNAPAETVGSSTDLQPGE
jgi:hypothetical protein